jgi:hypothetical protein
MKDLKLKAGPGRVDRLSEGDGSSALFEADATLFGRRCPIFDLPSKADICK